MPRNVHSGGNPVVAHAQIAARPFFDPTRISIARYNKLMWFEDYCDKHGVARFRTATALCLLCHPPGKRGRPLAQDPRARARRDRRRWYIGQCEEHGPVAFAVRTGKCLTCFTDSGLPRMVVTDDDRLEARRHLEPTYLGVCVEHGTTPFHVSSGKCLTCFTAAGYPRQMGRLTNPERIAARQAGRRQYLAECAEHGMTDHGTQTGKCLICFNAMGYPRP